MKRLLSIVLTLVMIVGVFAVFPVSTAAEESENYLNIRYDWSSSKIVWDSVPDAVSYTVIVRDRTGTTRYNSNDLRAAEPTGTELDILNLFNYEVLDAEQAISDNGCYNVGSYLKASTVTGDITFGELTVSVTPKISFVDAMGARSEKDGEVSKTTLTDITLYDCFPGAVSKMRAEVDNDKVTVKWENMLVPGHSCIIRYNIYFDYNSKVYYWNADTNTVDENARHVITGRTTLDLSGLKKYLNDKGIDADVTVHAYPEALYPYKNGLRCSGCNDSITFNVNENGLTPKINDFLTWDTSNGKYILNWDGIKWAEQVLMNPNRWQTLAEDSSTQIYIAVAKDQYPGNLNTPGRNVLNYKVDLSRDSGSVDLTEAILRNGSGYYTVIMGTREKDGDREWIGGLYEQGYSLFAPEVPPILAFESYTAPATVTAGETYNYSFELTDTVKTMMEYHPEYVLELKTFATGQDSTIKQVASNSMDFACNYVGDFSVWFSARLLDGPGGHDVVPALTKVVDIQSVKTPIENVDVTLSPGDPDAGRNTDDYTFNVTGPVTLVSGDFVKNGINKVIGVTIQAGARYTPVLRLKAEGFTEFTENSTVTFDGAVYTPDSIEMSGTYATFTLKTYYPGHVHTPGSEWITDGENHWHECTECHDKTDFEMHIVKPATTTSPSVCSVCGMVLSPAIIPFVDITAADVTPAAGEKAGDHMAYTLPADCHYQATMAGWWDIINGRILDPDDVFEAGGLYCASWNFVADEGFAFTDDVMVTINGSVDDVDAEHSYIDLSGEEPLLIVSAKGVFAEEKPTVDSSKMFKDVKDTSWFKGAVDYVVSEGLMNGVSEDTFNPNGTMTRAMLVTVLWRLEGSPVASVKDPFTDLKQDWYKAAVAWAYEHEIVNGTAPDKFDPNGAITREQMAAIFYRYSDYKGYDVSSRGDISTFPDAAEVHSYANDPISWTVGEGLIGGVAKDGKSYLTPRGSATRAQVATILQRFCGKH